MDISIKKNYLIKGTKLIRPLPPIGHNNLDDGIEQRFNQILRGCINFADIHDSQLREVRIFLSSTFSDFKVERNLFTKHIIPSLNSICNDYGLSLRLCDMRWGVTDSAVNEHLVERLCLKEIKMCHKTSLGPFFVLLIGDRYGYQPIPSELPSSQFEAIYKIITENFPKEAELFSKWFQKDMNAEPPIYNLLPIKTFIPKYGDYEDEIMRRESGHEWWQIEESIRRCLKKTFKIAISQGLLTNEQKRKLIKSVTETEFWSAVMDDNFAVDKLKTSRCLAYERQLNGLVNDLQSECAIKYIDYVTRDNEVIFESSAQSLLLEFKNSIQKVELRHYRKFNVPWVSNGITESLISHKKYLDDLSSIVIRDIKTLIVEKMSALEKHSGRFNNLKMHLQSEIIHHWQFCLQRCSNFCGRKVQQEMLFNLLDPNYDKPIIVHGSSGCGKTSFLSKISAILQEKLVNKTVENKNKIEINENANSFQLSQYPVIILRFIGTSLYSTSLQQLLFSVCFQIQLVYKLKVKFGKMTSLSSLKWLFNYLIQHISRSYSEESPLIIIFDSVDQLYTFSSVFKDGMSSNSLDWIPAKLPPGIKIIISLVTENFESKYFQNFQNRLSESKHQFIHINSFDEGEVILICQTLLQQRKRKLNDLQMDLVISKLIQNPHGLYVKLTLEQAVTWKSYMPVEKCIIKDCVESAVNFKFSCLEEQYGMLLISHTLSYLTLGYNGLTEIELEDLLSLQDDVLNEIYQYHDPPISGIIRLPSLLWSRIHSDLAEYIVKKQTDGKVTLYWYHSQIHQCAMTRYIKDSEILQNCHKEMADYYAVCGRIKKTCFIQNHKRKFEIKDADRLINNPPINEKESRKLHALSFHLIGSRQIFELSKLCIANLNFLFSYAKCFGVQELILFLKSCENVFPSSKIINIIKRCIIFLEPIIETNIEDLPSQLLGQLKYLDTVIISCDNKSDFLDNETVLLINSLCLECRANISSTSHIIPLVACFPSCLGSIKLYKEKVKQIVQIPGNSLYIILIGLQGDDWIVRLFKPRDQISICSIILENKPLSVTVPSHNLSYIFIQDNNNLCIYDIDTGQFGGKISLYYNKMLLNECISVDAYGKWISIAAQNRIAILEYKLFSIDKNPITHKICLTAREVDKTLSMCFVQSNRHNVLITTHVYNSKSHKKFLFKIWQFDQNQELCSVDLQNLSLNYADNCYIWPFYREMKESGPNSYLDNYYPTESVLLFLPNGICFFIPDALDRKSFKQLTKSENGKSEKEKLRSIFGDENIVTIVRSSGYNVFVEMIDKSGIVNNFHVPIQINCDLISFAAIPSSMNSSIFGLKSGLIYYFYDDNFVSWNAHRGPINYVSMFQPAEVNLQQGASIEFITFSHTDKVVKCWNRNIGPTLNNEIFSQTIFEKTNCFAISALNNIYAILDENHSMIYHGTFNNFKNEIKMISLDSKDDNEMCQEYENNFIFEIEIALQNQALLIFFRNKVKLFNLTNGKLWSSVNIDSKNIDKFDKINKKIYWNCLQNQNELILLTFQKSTGYFNLDCYVLPLLKNIRWSKRFLPPINYTNPTLQLKKLEYVQNATQKYLVILWKNSKIHSGIIAKDVLLTKGSFQLMSLNLQDSSHTLSLIPCFNQDETRKNSTRNVISRITNQPAFSYCIPTSFPNNFSNDVLHSNILIGGYGEILIWDIESGSCKLPKIPNCQTWFKHSSVTRAYCETESEFLKSPFPEKKSKSRLSNSMGVHQFKRYPITALFVTHECALVISGCSAGFVVVWKWAEAILFNGNEPEPINKYRFVLSAKHANKVMCFSFIADCQLLISGSANMEIFVTNILTNECLQKLSVHCCPISFMIISENYFDNDNNILPKIILVCKAFHIGQNRMLLFEIVKMNEKILLN